MPAQREVVGFCPQYRSRWRVPGSRGATYDVELADLGASCTCPAFRYAPADARTCKHIGLVWERGCLYNPQWRDAGPNDYASLGIELVACDDWHVIPGDVCACGGEKIAVAIAV
jgi:hypothetical protein